MVASNQASKKEDFDWVNLVSVRFKELKEQLGKNIKTISEVYIFQDHDGLVYRPIAHLDTQDVISGRQRILSRKNIELAGIEVALNQISEVDPKNRRRRGCFRLVKWYTPDFVESSIPDSVSNRRSASERNSGWLCGGPQ